jgi:hypothetical protein
MWLVCLFDLILIVIWFLFMFMFISTFLNQYPLNSKNKSVCFLFVCEKCFENKSMNTSNNRKI